MTSAVEFRIARENRGGEHLVLMPEEAFLSLWKLAGGKPDDPFKVTFVTYDDDPWESPNYIGGEGVGE